MENSLKTLRKFDFGQQVIGKTQNGRVIFGTVCDVGHTVVVLAKANRHKVVAIGSIRFVKQLSLFEGVDDAA